MKFLLKFFQFIYNDIKSDIKTIKGLASGKINAREKLNVFFTRCKNELSFSQILKEYYPLFIVIILAFCCGWFIAAKYYEVTCNNLIIANLEQSKQFVYNFSQW
jgi:hypothetical protein